VSICVQDDPDSYEQLLIKLFGTFGHGPIARRLDSVGDPDTFCE